MGKKKTANKKKITVQEFKAWLEGVEEMQPEGWHPTKEQWEIIREKIKLIVDTPPQTKETKRSVPPPPPGFHPAPVPPPPPQQPLPTPAIQTEQSSVIDQALKKEALEKQKAPPFATDPKKPVKAPDIDGPYESSFI